jgi:type I restriction enzyme, S subunit
MGDGGYQRYGAYQDSGIEWLGEIPAHWKPESSLPVARLGGDRLGLKRCRDRDISGRALDGLGHSESLVLGGRSRCPKFMEVF